MNLFNTILSYNSEKINSIQEKCDTQLSKHNCKEEIINYLLASRYHARQQKKELSNSGILNISNVFEKINKENELIVNELNDILDKPNFCQNIKHSILFNLINNPNKS